MDTSRTTAVASTDSDFATFGAVHLDVTDGERALRFWRDLAGLQILDGSGPEIRLTSTEPSQPGQCSRCSSITRRAPWTASSCDRASMIE